MIIRKEQASDHNQIWALNSESYASVAEANLVNDLRNSGCEFLSLVAVIEHIIVGHILFTPVELLDDLYQINDAKIMGLAPMAVSADYRLQGVGTELIKSGIQYCRELDYDAITVLGHPSYYPRFGFVPAKNYNFKSEYDVPDDVFMIYELILGSLRGLRGTILYHDRFNKVA
jgi:putative acetyltransferase